MSALGSWWSEPWVMRLGWVLIHFIWQGVGIALLLAVTLRILARASSQARYVVIGGVLLLCGAMPVATWAMLGSPVEPPLTASIIAEAENVKPPGVLDSDSIAMTTFSPPGWPDRLMQAASAALPYVVGLWFGGVVVLTLRLTLGWTMMQRLCRSGLPMQDSLRMERFQSLLERMQVSVPVRLLESALVEVPTLIGWLRPTILVPASVLLGLTPDQLEAILAHELAHVRRYDYLVNLFQTVIETILFYHPAVWWISRKLREERENCCDDIALEVMHDKLVYVSALAQLEQARAMPLALTASGGSLLQRIRRIVGANDRKVSAWPLWVLIIGVLSVVCLTKAKASAETKPAEVASQLAIAVQNGDTVTLQKLLDGGIDLTEDKSNYVYWAVSYDQPKILEMLLDHDAATNLIGPNNESPLNLARRVHPDLVPILEAGMARNRPAHITRLTAALNSFHIDLPALSDVPLGEVVSMLFSDWYKEDTASNPEPYVRTVIPLFAPLVKVTLPPLKNVSIMEALQDITSAAHCKFHVDEDAVYISPPSYGTVLTVRTFLVPPGFFQPKPGTTVDVKQELISLGVEFPAGAGATYLPGTSKLIVRDTPDELDKIQTEIEMAPKVLGPETTDAVFPSPAATVASPAGKASQKPVSQIEVEVKVAEIPEDGYEANKAAFDAGLEKSSVSVISLIENLKGSSFVSTPSVTTRPGKKATIEIVREFPFPSSWEAPHGTTSITPSSPTSYIPPTPKEFVTKDLGISAEITPSLDEDNGKIILDGELSVTDFEGFTESNLVGTGTPSFTTRETHFLEALDDHELKGIWIPGVYYEGQTTSSTLVGTTLGSAKSGTKRLILFLSARLVR